MDAYFCLFPPNIIIIIFIDTCEREIEKYELDATCTFILNSHFEFLVKFRCTNVYDSCWAVSSEHRVRLTVKIHLLIKPNEANSRTHDGLNRNLIKIQNGFGSQKLSHFKILINQFDSIFSILLLSNLLRPMHCAAHRRSNNRVA